MSGTALAVSLLVVLATGSPAGPIRAGDGVGKPGASASGSPAQRIIRTAAGWLRHQLRRRPRAARGLGPHTPASAFLAAAAEHGRLSEGFALRRRAVRPLLLDDNSSSGAPSPLLDPKPA